jgi:hypothetical protein
VLAVIAAGGCAQSDLASSWSHEAAYRRQVDLDVAAIIVGMALAHGVQVVASMPER